MKGANVMPTPKKKAATTGEKKQHAQPDYGLVALDELPPEPARAGNVSRYKNLLDQVAEQPGQLFRIAEFATRATAKRVATKIEDGKIPVVGELSEWTITPQNTAEGSALFAQYDPAE